MEMPTPLVIVALGVIALTTMRAIAETLQQGIGESPLPVWLRWVTAACWVVVAVDLVAEGMWPWAIAPMIFAAMALGAGHIHAALRRHQR